MKNKIKNILFCLLMIVSIQSIHSSVPTTEALFRNNNNSDVQSTLVMVTMQAKKEVNSLASEEKEADENIANTMSENNELTENQKESKVNLKYLFSINGNEDVEVVRVVYKTGKMQDENIIDVNFYKNLEDGVVKSEDRKGLVLSLLSSLALNRSEEMSAFLKKNSANYKSNEELIDPEKRDLYREYKKYLKLVKDDESLKETLDNPMAPKDEEVREIVEKIKERPFLQKDPHVTLEKKDAKFIWKVTLDTMTALFDGKTQRLEKLNFTKKNEETRVSFDDYILFNGTNELPKIINIDTDKYKYTLRTSSHVQLNLGNKSMWRRYNEYVKKLKANGEVESVDYFFL